MAKNKYWWRRLFSNELTRADAEMSDVWIRNDSFRLVKFPSSMHTDGKWGIFTPLDRFIGRCSSSSPPFNWANKLIADKMNDKSYHAGEDLINEEIL